MNQFFSTGSLVYTIIEGIVWNIVDSQRDVQDTRNFLRIFMKDEYALILSSSNRFVYVLFNDGGFGWVRKSSVKPIKDKV